MFVCTIEDRKTHARTRFLCGCEDVIASVVEHCKTSSAFASSEYREISTDAAETIAANRLPNDQELIYRLVGELSPRLI